MNQMLVPANLAVFTAVFFGVTEIFGGLLLIIPRYRRWGALLCSGMLVAFMVYMAWNYTALQGMDCTCFPWLKRAVGPAFFWSDAAMIVMAAIAGCPTGTVRSRLHRARALLAGKLKPLVGIPS